MNWKNFLKSMIIIFLNMVGAMYTGALFASFFGEDLGVVFGGGVYLMAVVIVYARKIIRQQIEILETLKNKEE